MLVESFDSDSEMDEGFFTFDILIYFFFFVSRITTWIWLVRLERLSFNKLMQQFTVSPLSYSFKILIASALVVYVLIAYHLTKCICNVFVNVNTYQNTRR
jgi:hypothetical protein